MGHHFSWRHDQVAKVEDCNSFIPSSNLGVASKQHSKVAQWWSTRLLTDRLRVRVPPLEPRCRSGGTGRRTGLKILRDLYSRTGSIPVFGTIFFKIVYRGSLVKRSRHRPFTAVTGVRFPYESPISCGCSSMVEFWPSKPAVRVRSPSPAPKWDHSSAGRAPALQAGGHRFEPCWSHH